MPSVILAGTTTGTALSLTSDTSGELQIQTNNGATTALTLTTGGNLNIPTTGARITGDFSNATANARVAIQTSTTNGNTTVDIIPNGTATLSQTAVWNNSNTSNAGYGSLVVTSSVVGLVSGVSGTGTALPLTFDAGGAERLRIDTSGNVGIGTNSPTSGLTINRGGGWSSSNFGKQLYLTTPTNSSNPCIGISDASGGNNWAVANAGGALTFNQMPAISDGSTAITERMRIDSSGRLLIGTTSALSNSLATFGNTTGSVVGWGFATLQNAGGITPPTAVGLSIGWNYSNGQGENNIVFGTAAGSAPALAFSTFNGTTTTERMRITSSGNLLVGYTDGGGNIGSIGAIGNFIGRAGVGGAVSNRFVINWTGSPQLWIDTTNIGTIAFTSDYRVKRNVETQTAPALERVMALRPVTYQMADYGDLFKSGEEVKEGFIAHEVQEVIPSGAEGVKDDETQIQSLRMDAILAVAVKAIQEQQAMIETLTTRLNALEGK